MNSYAKTESDIALLQERLDRLNKMERTDGLDAGQAKYKRDLEDGIVELRNSLPKERATVSFAGGSGRSGGTFRSMGEQFRAIAMAATPGQRADDRLFRAAGLNETTPSEGGFLVQQDFSYDLLKGVFEQGRLPELCNRFQISGDGIKLPLADETSRVAGSRWGGTRGYWLSEAAEITSSKPTFRQLELALKKMAVLCYASDEVLSDANVLERIIQQSFADEMSFLLNEAIIRGSGSGQPLGILNSDALVEAQGLSGQGATTIIYENVVEMWSRLLPTSKGRAVWLAHPDATSQLYQMSLTVGTGGSAVYMPAGGASATPYATLFGRPIIECESCSQLGTVGDIILADMSGYVLAEKAGGPKMASSIAVRFQYDEMAYRMTYRVDGSPMLAAPITPAQGSNTLSHFVALRTARND